MGEMPDLRGEGMPQYAVDQHEQGRVCDRSDPLDLLFVSQNEAHVREEGTEVLPPRERPRMDDEAPDGSFSPEVAVHVSGQRFEGSPSDRS